jgi:hypothetical protein
MLESLNAELVDLVSSEIGNGRARVALTLSACCCCSSCNCIALCG